MATVPLSGTDISLYTGIPFSNDYKHTRWFDDITAQQTWFSSKTVVHQISQSTFQRNTGSTFIRCDKSIDELRGVNYLKFRNTDYNNKWFYAFVTQLEYKNSSMTNIHFQIDVLQTWRFEMNFKPSLVEREHCPQYYSDGRPVHNSIDEGLDYGDEYDTVWVKQVQPTSHKWLVILAKEPMHDGATKEVTPKVVGTPSPLSVYITPFKDDDSVPNIVLPDGMGLLASKPSDVLKGLYTDSDAVSNIVSIYVTDYTGIVGSYDAGSNTYTFTPGNTLKGVQVGQTGSFFNCIYVEKVKNFGVYTEDVGDKYDGYAPVTESKLLMYPYTVLILDDFKGNRATYHNENIIGTRLLMNIKGSLGTSNKVSYGFSDYNYKYNGTLENEIADEYALINNSPNDIPIITDLLSAYLQGNKNQISVQQDSNTFNGLMSGMGSLVGLGTSMMTANVPGMLSSGVEMIQGQGNMMLQSKAIMAKQKDINNVPPNIQKQGSNTSYEMGNDYSGVFVIKKQIKPEYRKKLEHFFKMFGYKTNEVKVPNFHTRRSWNFVKTNGCYIRGNFANEDLQELKNIFDKGITLWHHEDMGNYDLDNSEV
jgi:hypothetical protein